MRLIGKLVLVLVLWPLLATAQTSQKKVTLTWTPNTESDLAGYQIFRGSIPCSQAVEGITLNATTSVGKVSTYEDLTIPDTSKEVCYGIKAYDTSSNYSELSNLVGKVFAAPTVPPPTTVVFAESTRLFTWVPNTQATSTKLYVHKSGQGHVCPGDFYFCGVVTGTSLAVTNILWGSTNDCWMTSVNADGIEGEAQGVPCSVGPRPTPTLVGHWDKKTDVPHSSAQNLKRYTIHALVNPKAALVGFAPILVKNYTYFFYASVKGYCGDGGVLVGHSSTGRVCDPTPLIPLMWTGLTATFDGVTLSIFKNGQLLTQGPAPVPADSTEMMQIAGSKFNETCNCDLEVWLYDQAMTATEVANLPKTPTAQVVIRATPTVLTFTSTAGEVDPPAQTVTVENAGTGTLTWSAAPTQSWLRVTPAGGTQTGTVAVSVVRGTLAVGTHTGAITLTAAGASPVSVSVTYIVLKDSTPPKAPSNLIISERPTIDSVVLSWKQAGGEPDEYRVERLNSIYWFEATKVPGALLYAQVPLPSSGRRLFRVCAVQAGISLCNNREGVWATR